MPIVALGALAVRRADDAPCRARSALGSLAYQTAGGRASTFSVWFALILRYSASRLSAFTFLTPLFGVAAGHLVLGEPLTPAFALRRGAGGGRPDPGQPAALRAYIVPVWPEG